MSTINIEIQLYLYITTYNMQFNKPDFYSFNG